MKLTRLKPALTPISPSRLSGITPKPISIDRKRGSAGVLDRMRIRQRDQGLCQECVRQGRPGPGWLVDHIVPLWEGGSDEDENKQTLCRPCHDAKSAAEAKRRAAGGW